MDTTVFVGRCVARTAEFVVLTCCPPAPDARNVSMRTSFSSSVNSIWSTPGRTTTDAVDVWMRTSFVGTRCTRCTPLSKRNEA